MSRTVEDWNDAAADAYSYLAERPRAFPLKKMLALTDDLCVRGTVMQSELAKEHGSENFIATTLSDVTTGVHGGGAVPKNGGWYRTTSNPLTYHVNPEFAAAWKAKRKLG